MSNPLPVKKKLFLYDYFLFLAFIALSAIGLFFHEMSETEMQNWVVANESKSLSELWFNMRYEPHPYLWHSLLYCCSKIYSHYGIAQLLHLLINAVAVFLILNFSPFQKRYIWTFVFGYFPFYEYNLITRNYALCFLLIAIILVLFRRRRNAYIGLFCCCALLANTHLYGLLMSAVVVLIVCKEFFLERTTLNNRRQLAFYTGVCCYLVILVATIYYTRLPDDSILKANPLSFSPGRIAEASLGIWKSLVPIPEFMSPGFWNSNLIASLSPPIFAVVSVFLYIVLMASFHQKPVALAFFVITSSAFIFLFFLSRTNEMRHFGFFYLSFFSALWLASYYQESNPSGANRLVRWVREKTEGMQKISLILILIIHLCCGLFFYLADFVRPFSQGKHVVQYLKDRNLSNGFIAVDRYHTIPAITGYLEKAVYSPVTGKDESFLVWDIRKTKVLTQEEIIDSIAKLSGQPSILLILNYKLELPQDLLKAHASTKIELLRSFEGSMCKYENFYVYTVNK